MDSELFPLLGAAIEELRQPRASKAARQLASQIEAATAALAAGDASANGTLYLIFAPRSDWSEIGGSDPLAIQLTDLLYPRWKAVR